MSQVKVKENESLESALKRFKRQTSRDGVIQEVRKREQAFSRKFVRESITRSQA